MATLRFKMPKCCVAGCNAAATVEVILYDVYDDLREAFFERDTTCPFLCGSHMVENEQRADGVRRPRGYVVYPFSNRDHAQGFTIYRPLNAVE